VFSPAGRLPAAGEAAYSFSRRNPAGRRAGQGAVGGEEGTRGRDAEELTVGCLENKHVTVEQKAAYHTAENRLDADGERVGKKAFGINVL